jgi:hypothetical protein
MKTNLLVAALLVVFVPVYALAQKQDAAALKANAQKVIKIITADKVKIQAYCDAAKVGEQIDDAMQKNDAKKLNELSQKMDELTKKLGAEYVELMEGYQDVDPDSKDSQEVLSEFAPLEKLCAK